MLGIQLKVSAGPPVVLALGVSPAPRGTPWGTWRSSFVDQRDTKQVLTFQQGRATLLRVPFCKPQAPWRGGGGESCHDVSTWAALVPSSSQRFAGLCSVGASVRLRHQTAFSEKQHYKQWGRFPGLSTKAYFTGNIVATIFIGRHLKWNWLDFDRLVFALMRCAEESG